MNRNLNGRQLILKYKEAHGSGQNPGYPTKQEIESAMEGLEADHVVDVFGDGSLTTPTRWWAALGGYGIWIPAWNVQGEDRPERREGCLPRASDWANRIVDKARTNSMDTSAHHAYQKPVCH